MSLVLVYSNFLFEKHLFVQLSRRVQTNGGASSPCIREVRPARVRARMGTNYLKNIGEVLNERTATYL